MGTWGQGRAGTLPPHHCDSLFHGTLLKHIHQLNYKQKRIMLLCSVWSASNNFEAPTNIARRSIRSSQSTILQTMAAMPSTTSITTTYPDPRSQLTGIKVDSCTLDQANINSKDTMSHFEIEMYCNLYLTCNY